MDPAKGNKHLAPSTTHNPHMHISVIWAVAAVESPMRPVQDPLLEVRKSDYLSDYQHLYCLCNTSYTEAAVTSGMSVYPGGIGVATATNDGPLWSCEVTALAS